MPSAKEVKTHISIHALREEGDHFSTLRYKEIHRFQSTPSVRRATVSDTQSGDAVKDFNPRPP